MASLKSRIEALEAKALAQGKAPSAVAKAVDSLHRALMAHMSRLQPDQPRMALEALALRIGANCATEDDEAALNALPVDALDGLSMTAPGYVLWVQGVRESF